MENRNYYVHGNTVRKLEPARREYISPEEREKIKRKKVRRKAVQRNRQRAMSMNMGYVGFLSACVAVCAVISFFYVQNQADYTHNMRKIAALQSQINTLREDNDACEKRIETATDVNNIKTIAVNELGMSYPTAEQVVYYTVENNNYMDQYKDIPEE